MREPELKELEGASRLAKGFFNRLIRRIECTKPVAGSNISIVQQDDGFRIDAADGGSSVTYPAVTFNVVTINVIALQVCSGGTTQTVYVLSTTNANAITMLRSATTAPLQVLIPNKN